MARVKGENWFRTLREFLKRDPPAVRFELRERTEGGSNTIAPFTIPDGWEDELLYTRVGDLCAQAQDDTDNSELGRRSYFIQAYDENGEAIGRSNQIRFFSEKNALDDGGVGGSELEGPNSKGLIAQLMRHTESMVRLNLASTQAQIAGLVQVNTQLLREKQEVEDRRLQLLVEMENLLSERHSRAMEERRETAKEQRMDQMMGQLNRVMPALVARILPGTAVAADASAQALAGSIKGLVEGLNDAQMGQILDALGQEKGAALIEIVGLVQQIESAPSTPAAPANTNQGASNVG